jgi:F-type H+-transporting ATPase subunit c
MRSLSLIVIATLVLGVSLPAMAAENAAAPSVNASGGNGLGVMGACLGAALAVIGGALGIGLIGSKAPEAIARQPEAAGSMFLAWLLPAAMIEGAMLFAVVVCYLAVSAITK